jgi:uncharacterized protein YecT (DUF1311 family)
MTHALRLFLCVASAASLAVATLAAVPANAGAPEIEARYSKTYKDCPGLAGGTAEMVGCIGDETTRQDKTLNDAYKKAMDGLNDRQKTALRTAQRAWIAYRDAWCEAQHDDEWGSISTIVANHCVLDETIRRTIELENYPPET